MEDGPGLVTPVGIVTVNTESVDYIIKQNMSGSNSYAKQRKVTTLFLDGLMLNYLNIKGKVTSAEVKSTTLNNSLGGNLCSPLTTWTRFSSAIKRETISYPFMFQ